MSRISFGKPTRLVLVVPVILDNSIQIEIPRRKMPRLRSDNANCKDVNQLSMTKTLPARAKSLGSRSRTTAVDTLMPILWN